MIYIYIYMYYMYIHIQLDIKKRESKIYKFEIYIQAVKETSAILQQLIPDVLQVKTTENMDTGNIDITKNINENTLLIIALDLSPTRCL